MAREYSIPSTSTLLYDYQLNIKPPVTNKNKRVVIIGVAEDGKEYEPISISRPEDAEIVWGNIEGGDLVRGIHECWNSQDGAPDIIGVRIGNGKKAILKLYEKDGSGVDEEQADTDDGVVSMVLRSKFSGAKYNQVTIRYDDSKNIAIYNPKTGLTTSISVDTTNPNNSSVDVHNVIELVNYINSNRNLSSIIEAETSGVLFEAEFKINSTTAGVTQDSTGVRLDLRSLIGAGVMATANDAFVVPVPTLPYGSGVVDTNGVLKNLTAANNIMELTSVESVSFSEWEKVISTGATATLGYMPLDGKGTSRWNTIQCLYDYNDDSRFLTDPSGVLVKSEYIYNINFALIDEIPTDLSGKDGTNTFTLSCDLPLDDSEEAVSDDVSLSWLQTNNSTYSSYYNPVSTNYNYATCSYVTPKLIDGELVRPSGYIQVFVSDSVDPNGNWVELPYDANSGIYMSSYDSINKKAVFSIGANAYLSNSGNYSNRYISQRDGNDGILFTNMSALVDGNNQIRMSKYIRVTANTVKGFISEVDTFPQLENISSTSLTSYFVRGDEIVFNKAPSYPLVINYGTRITYEIDTNVALTDAVNGEISFLDPELLPGPGGNELSAVNNSHVRIKYKYMANFPNITSLSKNLSGGTNGNKLTVKQRETELKKAYEYLADFPARFWVPMGAYIDDIKEEVNRLTGAKEKQLPSYAIDIEEFLEGQSINSMQPHGILGVKPISGNKILTVGERDAWVNNLVNVDLTSPTRGANAMNNILTKFVSVAAFEPVFNNIGRGLPYVNNGQAAYAGELASLPYDISAMNKSINGITTLRFELSTRQHELMNSMRYVTMRSKNNGYPVILNDITAAPYGSDYTNWTNFSIIAEAADRIKMVAESYLGRPNSPEVRNSMDHDISSALNAMNGVYAFNFSINSTLDQQVLGVVEIDLVIVPIFTMKKIRTSVRMRKSLPTTSQ